MRYALELLTEALGAPAERIREVAVLPRGTPRATWLRFLRDVAPEILVWDCFGRQAAVDGALASYWLVHGTADVDLCALPGALHRLRDAVLCVAYSADGPDAQFEMVNVCARHRPTLFPTVEIPFDGMHSM